MMNLNSAVKYFKDCYVNDIRPGSISNVFTSEVENLSMVPNQEELLNDHLPYYPIADTYAEELENVLKVYGKEKEICYFSYFLLGEDELNSKKRRIIAPLFIYPAQVLHINGLSYLSIHKEKYRLNTEILRPLYNQEQHAEDFNECISENFMSVSDYSLLGYQIDTYFDNIDTTLLVDFPNLLNDKKLKQLSTPSQVKKRKGRFLLVPASGMGIIKRRGEAVGVLNELNDLAKTNDYAAPLQNLLGETPLAQSAYVKGQTPSILSKPQLGALEAASRYPVSVLVGPPGTGKSYTIASLAIEHVSKNKSVLIVSRTDQAVDVVAHKIEKELELKNVVVRAGRQQYLRELKSGLQDILNGVNLISGDVGDYLDILSTNIRHMEARISDLETEFLKIAKFERRWGLFLSKAQKNIFLKLKEKYIQWKSKKQQTAWLVIEELEQLLDNLSANIKKYIALTYEAQKLDTVNFNRNELKLLLQALRARTGLQKENLFKELDKRTLLRTFPVWLVNMKDISKALPLQKELFDLAIIDEATQCDTASSLPIFQRAKHVVITGDPKQLRHISFLPRSIQQKLYSKHLQNNGNAPLPAFYDYRKSSILDAVNDKITDQKQVSFLNEHFRSMPAIIRFSNRFIYNNALHIMTEKPDIPPNEGLEIIHCNGTRDKSGANAVEANSILNKIEEIYENSKMLPQESCPSIGILSPLRNQVEYLKKQGMEQLSSAIFSKHELLIGTAYEFQGEERDVMFISLCVDDHSHAMAFHHINKPDVFNVSITRARSMQYVYCSFDPDKLPLHNLVKEFILQSAQETKKVNKPKVNKDGFLDNVCEFLSAQNLKVWKAYPIAGIKVDVLVQNPKGSFGIDLIGFPGQFEDAFTIERYKILRRAQLPIMPLPYTTWIFQRDLCEKAIKEFIS